MKPSFFSMLGSAALCCYFPYLSNTACYGSLTSAALRTWLRFGSGVEGVTRNARSINLSRIDIGLADDPRSIDLSGANAVTLLNASDARAIDLSGVYGSLDNTRAVDLALVDGLARDARAVNLSRFDGGGYSDTRAIDLPRVDDCIRDSRTIDLAGVDDCVGDAGTVDLSGVDGGINHAGAINLGCHEGGRREEEKARRPTS
ncbi:hypothetical protein PG996_014709 [Apiospora saccharicola]|uniref:Pentapeptide repeat-containing protein n=1 Tax=Apiospora saccharicola TaxID=335842 RepID=A0ABR1TJ23_9PEZI